MKTKTKQKETKKDSRETVLGFLVGVGLNEKLYG